MKKTCVHDISHSDWLLGRRSIFPGRALRYSFRSSQKSFEFKGQAKKSTCFSDNYTTLLLLYYYSYFYCYYYHYQQRLYWSSHEFYFDIIADVSPYNPISASGQIFIKFHKSSGKSVEKLECVCLALNNHWHRAVFFR